jgi:hypothetical protein
MRGKDSTMARRLWTYRNDFGWFAADPEACDDEEDRIDTVELPGGETSFVVDTIPGAVTYRISVRAFDVVSGMTRQ